MDTMWVIGTVMLAAGVLGGSINFFISEQKEEKPLPWRQHVIVGTGASFMVPLFLNMISSNLLKEIRGEGKEPTGDLLKLFVLAGFCLVAAVSSRAFIRTISDRLLQEVKDVRAVAQDARAEAAAATAVVAPFVEEEESPFEAPRIMTEFGPATSPRGAISNDDAKIIRSLATGGFSMRSLTGIAKDTGLEKQLANNRLSKLMSSGLVVQAQSKSGQPRWYLSALGREEHAATVSEDTFPPPADLSI
jgi:hypothetical protein